MIKLDVIPHLPVAITIFLMQILEPMLVASLLLLIVTRCMSSTFYSQLVVSGLDAKGRVKKKNASMTSSICPHQHRNMAILVHHSLTSI
jgi:hypothetical protein